MLFRSPRKRLLVHRRLGATRNRGQNGNLVGVDEDGGRFGWLPVDPDPAVGQKSSEIWSERHARGVEKISDRGCVAEPFLCSGQFAGLGEESEPSHDLTVASLPSVVAEPSTPCRVMKIPPTAGLALT